VRRAFEAAIANGDADALRALLERGEDVDQKDRHGQTAVMLAARNGHLEVLRVLVAHGAALDHTAKHGLSALMLAAVNGREAEALLPVEAGPHPGLRGSGAPNFAGRTALDLLAVGLRPTFRLVACPGTGSQGQPRARDRGLRDLAARLGGETD